MDEKKPLTCLFHENPKTPEGKYLVKRRDGTVVEWPSFVLGARDPDGAVAMIFYAFLKMLPEQQRDCLLQELHKDVDTWLAHPEGKNKSYMESVLRFSAEWQDYRAQHGDGDPLMGAHRPDDPDTIAEMKKGRSA